MRPPPAHVCETDRLVIRWLTTADAAFVQELVTDPDWLRYIGDRGVRSLDDARDYLQNGPIAMYAECGFGLYMVELRESRIPIGICGLVKRAYLEDVDLGFAFLPQYRSRGYAAEAAAAVLEHGRRDFALQRVVAIVLPENRASIRLLEKLGFGFERMIQMPNEPVELCLFSSPRRVGAVGGGTSGASLA